MEVLIKELTPLLSAEQDEAAQRQALQRKVRQQNLIDSRRAMVLDAALAVFTEQGVDGINIRDIAKRAGYTAGAIYSYFDSKEAIYAALLEESLQRLQAAVDAVRSAKLRPDELLHAKAVAWFGFYANSRRDLDLALYWMRGFSAGAWGLERNRALKECWQQVLQASEDALTDMALSAEAAARENSALFAHGLGLLLLEQTGNMRMLQQDPSSLFQDYLRNLLERLLPDAQQRAAACGQSDLFGH